MVWSASTCQSALCLLSSAVIGFNRSAQTTSDGIIRLFHGPQRDLPVRSYKFVHYCDVIMGGMASDITSLTIVYSWKRSFRCRSKKISKLRITGICARNSPVNGEFPVEMASNAENVSIRWRHHGCAKVQLNLKAYMYRPIDYGRWWQRVTLVWNFKRYE